MDSAVARTLAELESKLQELERALSAAGGGQQRQPETQVHGGGTVQPGYEPSPQSDRLDASGADARLVDERLEQSLPAPAPPPPQAYHEGHAASAFVAAPPPRPPSAAPIGPDDSIELAELVRFRDRLEQAMRDLLSDYEQVIRLRGASAQRPPLDQR